MTDARDAQNGVVKMTPLNGLIGYALRRAQLAIFADFNQALASLNLRPSQFAVLILYIYFEYGE